MKSPLQLAAERIHDETNATLVVCIAADFDHNSIRIGAWCPDAEVLVILLRKVADQLERGEGTVIDLRTVDGRRG